MKSLKSLEDFEDFEDFEDLTFIDLNLFLHPPAQTPDWMDSDDRHGQWLGRHGVGDVAKEGVE